MVSMMIEQNISSISPDRVEIKQLTKVRKRRNKNIGGNNYGDSLILYIKDQLLSRFELLKSNSYI